jgi:glycosyltransferase involved in cell wall biosynthesis
MNIGIIAGESFFKTSAVYFVQQLQNHCKIFLFNKTQNIIDLSGITIINVGKPFTKILQRQRILAMIKKNQIEKLLVFHSSDIVKNHLPQIFISNDDISGKKIGSEKINYGSAIITFSTTQQQQLQYLFPHLQEKIFVAAPILQPDFIPLHYEEKKIAKQQFAKGKEYFVCADFFTEKEEFLTLLKAFSAFKKLQQSNWMLVVLWRSFLPSKEKEEILHPLSSFKFREDVIIVNDWNIQTLKGCIGGAYALIGTDTNSVYNPSIWEALQCGVPVISSRKSPMNIYTNGIVETASSAPEHIAEKMMDLYKDENLRNWLSQKAGEAGANCNAEKNLHNFVKLLC